MAKKEYQAKASLTVGDLATIVDLGEAILPLVEFNVSAKNAKTESGAVYTIVSEGTEYRIVGANGSVIAKVMIDSERGLVYDTELKSGKFNAAGGKWRPMFYDSLDTIYAYALREIENSSFNPEYLEKEVQNNTWVALMLGIKVNEYSKQDPTTATGFSNAKKALVDKEDWEKAWSQVVKNLVEVSTTLFANNVADQIESGDLNKALKYLALLPADTISGFAKQLREVNALNPNQEANLKQVTEI